MAWTSHDGEDDEIEATFLRHGAATTGRRVWRISRNRHPDILPTFNAMADGSLQLAWSSFDGSVYRQERARLRDGRWIRDREGEHAVAGTREGPTTESAAQSATGSHDHTVFMGAGDSVTYGIGSALNGPPSDYLTRVEHLLKGPWTAKNHGVPGATSATLLTKLDGFLDAEKPGLTLLMIGVNDAHFGISAETTLFNIAAAADKVTSRGGRVILCTTTPVKPAERPVQYERLARLNPRIASLASQRGYPLIDFWRIFHSYPPWISMLMDPASPNHPGEAGYALMAERARALIVSRNLLNGHDRLRALPPLEIEASLPRPTQLAWRLDLSQLSAADLTAIAPLDIDGDGFDEIALLRSHGGRQAVFVFEAPALNAPPTSPALIVRDEWTYPAGGPITHLFRIDLEGDGKDEVGLLRLDAAADLQTLEIWRAHPRGALSWEQVQATKRLVLDRWRIPAGGVIHDIAALQADEDPGDEIVILERRPDTGEHSVLIFDTPSKGETAQMATTPLLCRYRVTGGARVLRVAGQDITDDSIDELHLLRAGDAAIAGSIEAYQLPRLVPGSVDETRLVPATTEDIATGGGEGPFGLSPLRLRLAGTRRVLHALALWGVR